LIALVNLAFYFRKKYYTPKTQTAVQSWKLPFFRIFTQNERSLLPDEFADLLRQAY
jgi:hypothetical protein